MGTKIKLLTSIAVFGMFTTQIAAGQGLSINAERLKSQEAISLKINSMEIYTPGAEQYERRYGHITGVAKTSSVKELQGKNHLITWGGKTCDPLPEWIVQELVDAKKTERTIQVRYSAVVGQNTKCVVGIGWY